MSSDRQDPSEDPWLLAQLKPNGYARAKVNLVRQGFATFMPVRAETLRHARGARQVLRPLFPGYLFVACDIGRAPWRAINGTYGVARLVLRTANSPEIVPPALMESLRARCDGAGHVLPPEALAPGDRVRILTGPMAQFIARIETLPGPDRVRVLLEFMGRAVRTEVPRAELERV